jgi:ubiquinone/menaquinone biosynthesis C-methylase UbiE
LVNKTVKTVWDPIIDNKPSIDSPRIRFSQKFASKYMNNGSHVLDIGCGNGSYTYLIDSLHCVGMDLTTNVLKMAKKYCVRSHFLVGSVLNLPFRDETFDVICMWEVIEHTPVGTESEVIAESQRVLMPGGCLLLSTPNRHFVSNIMDPALFLRGHRHYGLEKLINLITSTGLIVKQHTIRGGLNTMIATNIFYFNKHVLHKKEGKMQKFFEQKSKQELNSENGGIATIFIAAERIDQQKK